MGASRLRVKSLYFVVYCHPLYVRLLTGTAQFFESVPSSDITEHYKCGGQNVVAEPRRRQYGTQCRKCGAEDDTSAHIVCKCEALASIRHVYLGYFLWPEDIKSISLGAA